MKNVYMENLEGIVKTAFANSEKAVYDWQTAIDMYDNEHHITEGIAPEEAAVMRSEFLSYVKGRTYDEHGCEVRKREPELTDEYMINGKKVRITGDMIKE